MRVVVVDAFERGNRGDAALLDVLLRQIATAYPTAEISIAGFEEPGEWPEFAGRTNLGSIRRYVGEERVSRIRQAMRGLTVLAVVLFAATRPTRALLVRAARVLPAEIRRELLAIAAADLVVVVGGGHLNARADLASDLSVFFLLLPIWLAQRFAVPVVAGPQSYGPFPRRRQRIMVGHVLSRVHTVLAREDISRHHLAAAGVDTGRVVRGVDSAFAFTGRSRRNWRAELDLPPNAPVAVITARQWLPAAAQGRYERALVGVIEHLLRGAGRYVVLAPQVTCAYHDDDDRLVNERLAASVEHPRLRTITTADFDHHDAFGLYAGAELVIGTRFHSVIFALMAGVPCIAIEYDHKTRGIMRDLGLEGWVVDIAEASTDLLVELADRLAEHRADYLATLRERLPPCVRQADAVVELLADVLPRPVERRHVA